MKIKLESFVKEKPKLIVKEGEKHLWDKFHSHHYMTSDFPNSAVFFTFYWVKDNEEILIGCLGVLFQIARSIKARRFTRIVILPEYQGLGFAPKMINSIAKYYRDEGIQKMFTSTFHPRLGKYMENSQDWVPSNNNMQEFKKNPNANSKTMNGVRDGVSMYRYNFIGSANYKLFSNPIEILSLKQQIRDMQAEGLKDTDEYKKLKIKLKSHNNPVPEVFDKSLLVSDENHIKQKEEHKRLFKPKRKPLSKEERQARKLELKKAKEGIQDNEW